MTKEENKELILKYPFLIPRNRFTGRIPESYDYSYTEMDNMPEGWRRAFGNPLLDDIKCLLKKADYIDEYRIMQIKEKYGGLRWYDSGIPANIADEFYVTLEKYSYISEHTCIQCGKFPVHMMDFCGWISPYCSECASKIKGMEVCDDEEFSPVITIKSYSDGQETERQLDCSDVIDRMAKA